MPELFCDLTCCLVPEFRKVLNISLSFWVVYRLSKNFSFEWSAVFFSFVFISEEMLHKKLQTSVIPF